jgi:hypothetical protein
MSQRLALAAVLGASLMLSAPARADLPEVAFGPVFEALCDDLRKSSDCAGCVCNPITSSSPTDNNNPEIAHGILVKLESKPDSDPFKTRFFVAIGSDKKLRNAGLIHKADATSEFPVYPELEWKKVEQFNDQCLACDHENVGLVHIFDLVIKDVTMFQNEIYESFEKHTTLNLLLTCFGAPEATCYSTPLGMSERTDRMSMAPGDKGKKGKTESWSRTWKIGGRNKMQVVLGPLTGNLAGAMKKAGLEKDRNEFHFGDIPTRAFTGKADR